MEIKNTAVCSDCIHARVCCVYDTLYKATELMDDFREFLDIEYDELLFQTLARNCRMFERQQFERQQTEVRKYFKCDIERPKENL